MHQEKRLNTESRKLATTAKHHKVEEGVGKRDLITEDDRMTCDESKRWGRWQGTEYHWRFAV